MRDELGVMGLLAKNPHPTLSQMGEGGQGEGLYEKSNYYYW